MILDLFLAFLKIGSLTIGGGYAMVPLIQSEVVDRHKWMSSEEFVDTLAIAQSTPGALAVNMSAYVGYKKGGIPGAILATVGCSLPAIIPILIISAFFSSFMNISIVIRLFKGLRPTVAALIVFSVYKIGAAGKIKGKWYLITAAAAAAIIFIKLDPIIILLCSSAIGYALYRGGVRK
jgi:chromate transporter